MKVETITPKKAAAWLSRNVNNRPRSPHVVKRYADAMRSGVWQLNGDCIRFNGNGDLIDGQHRLAACISADVPFRSYVLRGLDHSAFDTIDQGKPRALSDVFARQGRKNYTALASAVRWIWMHGEMSRNGTPRADQGNKILEEHPGIENAVEFARSLRKKNGKSLIHHGLLSFLVYGSGLDDEASANHFWADVCEGTNLKRGTPQHQLHSRLVSNLQSVARLDIRTTAALCIKAWNSSRTANPPKVLKWSEGESFPQFKELSRRQHAD